MCVQAIAMVMKSPESCSSDCCLRQTQRVRARHLNVLHEVQAWRCCVSQELMIMLYPLHRADAVQGGAESETDRTSSGMDTMADTVRPQYFPEDLDSNRNW